MASAPAFVRVPDAPVDSAFVNRWSPRGFANKAVSEADLKTVLEAARWAPSASNEQPWIFAYAAKPADKARFLLALNERNQVWAKNAAVLMFVMSRRQFRNKPVENRWGPFDSGAAWMSLALQANRLGLMTHAMGGFDNDKAHAVVGTTKESHDIWAAVALGYHDPAMLPETFNEGPSPRIPVTEFAFEGAIPSR